ncbi:MAG: MFS transporter [Clostridia bacterium]|jgi:glycoside/pentoside/hexuronide:cation symporter, GPH family|nr:MFS transporter [Clostridia bacterium]
MRQIKRWQEPFYGIGGFGTGFMLMVAMSYLAPFYLPPMEEITGGAINLAPVILFTVLFTISRVIDGLIDIPIASWSDNLRSKWGRRRPLILLGIVPMIAAYALMWFPPVKDTSWVNAVYVGILSVIFFCSYTLSTVPYLSALSEIVPDEKSRVRVASWQTFFNTMGYVLAYVLMPILFGLLGKQMAVLVLVPCMLTILIPVFIIKEKSTKGEGAKMLGAEPKVPLWTSFKMTIQNKKFMRYLVMYALLWFGLSAFLGGLYYMASDMMGLTKIVDGVVEVDGAQLAIMNAAAFAPVPIMLLIMNAIVKKKGIMLALKIGLAAFAVAMSIFILSWTGWGITMFKGSLFTLMGAQVTQAVLLGAIAGFFGSFAIGVFFTVPYAIPAQIAAEEAAVTGKNRAAMYLAVQGVVNQIVGALAGTLFVVNVAKIYLGTANATGILLVPPVVIIVSIISLLLVNRINKAKTISSESA